MISFIQPTYSLRIREEETSPNIIFAGPPGCGKTSLSYHLFSNIKEYNASDERGIKFIRENLKSFLKLERKNIQTVLLDEADYLTRDAQAALRRLMEDYQDKVRFILTCNDISRIISPIQSRCFRFQLKSDLNEFDISVFDRFKGRNIDLLEYYNRNKFIYFLCRGDKRLFINTLYGNMITQSSYDSEYIDRFFTMKDKKDALNFIEYFSMMGFNFSLFVYELIFYLSDKLDIFEESNELSGIFVKYRKNVAIDLSIKNIAEFLVFLGKERILAEICFAYIKMIE